MGINHIKEDEFVKQLMKGDITEGEYIPVKIGSQRYKVFFSSKNLIEVLKESPIQKSKHWWKNIISSTKKEDTLVGKMWYGSQRTINTEKYKEENDKGIGQLLLTSRLLYAIMHDEKKMDVFTASSRSTELLPHGLNYFQSVGIIKDYTDDPKRRLNFEICLSTKEELLNTLMKSI